MRTDIVVIGAGPAGMMAAITAAENGAEVIMLDLNRQPGRKLLLTGKGRCNVTNNCTKEEFFDNITCNAKFLYSAYSAFSAQDTMSFFDKAGVQLKTERGKRVFPVSDKSADINNALIHKCDEQSIRFLRAKATEIIISDGRITGVKAGNTVIECKSCILAAGGMSYKATGSDGNGYALAKKAGHTVSKIRPSLVPLVCEGNDCQLMTGLTLKNIGVTVSDSKGKQLYSDFGELTFMPYGISGPVTLSASCNLRFDNDEKYIFKLDLKPGLSEEQIEKRILRDIPQRNKETLAQYLRSLLPSQMTEVFCRRSGISEQLQLCTLTKEQRNTLIKNLKCFSIAAIGFRPINEAIITSGGISTKEISPKTMESKLVKGLYFAGEIIDVDAYTGGFNLQIAFSTGFCAGKFSSEEIQNDKCSN